MDFLAKALPFITKAFTENKRVKELKDDFIEGFIGWIDPIFFEKDEKLANELKESPEAGSTQARLEIRLEELLKDDTFRTKLEAFINDPKAEKLKRKNVFDGEMGDIEGDIKLGDKDTSSDAGFDEKNIFSGKVGNIKGGFHLGDG